MDQEAGRNGGWIWADLIFDQLVELATGDGCGRQL